MIDYIEGLVEFVESDMIILGTNQGVGYRIFCPNPYIYKVNEKRRVYTHHYVREDAIHLFGFPHREERNLFRKLIDVSGIGPKGALAILAAAAPEQIVSAIQREDVDFLTKFPGIGKKTAGRLVLDLKDKLDGFKVSASSDRYAERWDEEKEERARHDVHQEAAEALKALGYHDKEVTRVMDKLKHESATTEQLIKKALQLFIST